MNCNFPEIVIRCYFTLTLIYTGEKYFTQNNNNCTSVYTELSDGQLNLIKRQK